MDTAGRVTNKRPLLAAAACVGLGIVLGRYLHWQILYVIAAAVLMLAAFYYGLSKKQGVLERGFLRKHVFWLVCAACLFAAAFLSANAYDVRYVETGDGLAVSGRVYSPPYQNDYGSTVCLIDNASIDGQPCGNIKLYVSDGDTLACGDIVAATADVEVPKGVRNPGGFDEKQYLLSQGVQYKAYADAADVVGERGGIAVLLCGARTAIANVMDQTFEADIAPVAKAMLLGDKQGLDEEVYTAFKDTGTAHVLAVSGLHAGILIASVYFAFRALRMGRTPRLAATLGFIVVYACVTGLSPSIVRASIMAGALLLGRYFGRQTDALNHLSLAFILSLAICPLDLFNAGFALSFGAVFGILTLGWRINRWLAGRLPNRLSFIGGLVSASVGATAGTLPILAASFNRISVFSVVTNLFVIPLATAAIAMVFLCTLLGLLIGPAAMAAGYAAAALIRGMLALIHAAAGLPLAALNVATPPWYFVLAWFALLFIASKYLLVKTRTKTAMAAAACAAVALAMLFSAPHGMYVAFLDVGQGDAAFVRTAQGGEYFIDGGRELSAQEVVDYAVRNGISPDAAFISHTDADHFSGIVAMYEAGLLHKAYCSPQEEATVRAAMPNADIVPIAAGDTVLLDEVTQALVLYPYADTSGDANDCSLVLMIEYSGHTAVFTGDISGATETAIFGGVHDVDVYKAAHHGSKFSSYRLPLSVLSPDVSVVSVGGNAFGHPSTLAMRNLSDYSERVYTTMQDCAVEVFIDEEITVHTFGE